MASGVAWRGVARPDVIGASGERARQLGPAGSDLWAYQHKFGSTGSSGRAAAGRQQSDSGATAGRQQQGGDTPRLEVPYRAQRLQGGERLGT